MGCCNVEVFNEKRAKVFFKAKFLGRYLVHVERHISLSSAWDVLYCMPDEETQICLAHQFIYKAYRLIGKRDGKPFPLLTVF
jgi:hypothetical protein